MTENEFRDIWYNTPEPTTVTYRLYHDQQGRLLFYSMEDCPGQWVEIDQEFFARSPSRVRVIQGQVHELEWRRSLKIQPCQAGRPCHPKDVSIIYHQPDAQNWAIISYEQN
jgi:hypothetical protein